MIDYEKIKLEELNQEAPERSLWYQAYLDYQLLYEGGLSFKRAAGRNSLTLASIQGAPATSLDLMANLGRRRRFLRQLEGEPDTKYISRWEACYYIPYIAAIIDYFRHWLFSSAPNIRPAIDAKLLADSDALENIETPEPPEWFDSFMRDATGAGCSFQDLGKAVFGDVLIYRRAGWLIATADMSLGETDAPITLTKYDARDILDWQEDGTGKLDWILLKCVTTRREFPNRRRMVEIRTYVDRDSWGAWEVTREPNSTEDIPILLGYGRHDLGEVPFEWMCVPEGMWVMNKLAAWQVDIFNQMSILTYGQLVSCFLQPCVTSAEATEAASSRIMGEDIVINLRTADGTRGEEKFTWVSPDVSPLEFNAKRIIEQRDEGYRIVHQMSLAVDSQAIGAIARSGVSKIEDRKAAEIMLRGYGGYVKDFQIRTLEKIGRLMGDNTKFTVEGYDSFEVSSLMEELQTAALAQTFNVESVTFNAELQKSIATGRIMNHLDETTKARIRAQIDASADQKAEMAALGPPQIDPATGLPMQSDATSPFGQSSKASKNPMLGLVQGPPKPPGPPVTG